MDRHFSEEEAREVFARAAERQHAVAAKGEGLSLAELRAIGAEAGLDPAHVEAAARSVALGEPETGRLSIGPLPQGVFRTVVLPGPPSDALWAEIVADARRTFAAQGKLSGAGRLREWRNSNLRISLEPEGDGSRLHLQTRRTDRTQLVIALAAVSAIMLVASLLFSIDLFANGGDDIVGLVMTAFGTGAGALGLGAEQRGWAATREDQFDDIARRAAGVIAEEAVAMEATETVEVATSTAPRIDPALLGEDIAQAPSRPSTRRRTR